ncbi:MAG TPA: hypothetical protein VID50_12370 [Candidatus Eisenbacteria bacterium]|jgi:hypothetical protein
MTRTIRIVLLGALALAVAALALASEPVQTKPSMTAPKKALKKARTANKEPGDTIKGWPHGAEEGRTWITVSGEVIDVFCYLDRGLTGEIHRQCAIDCIHGGMPMGLLTRDGQVILLCKHHDYAMDPYIVTYAKPYNDLIEWAARQVQVGGFLLQRKGWKAIEVIKSRLLEEYLVPAGGLDSARASMTEDSTATSQMP